MVLIAMGFCDLCKYWMKVMSPAYAEKIVSFSFDSSLLAAFSFRFAQGFQALEEVKVNKQLPPPRRIKTNCVCHICKKNVSGSLAQEQICSVLLWKVDDSKFGTKWAAAHCKVCHKHCSALSPLS